MYVLINSSEFLIGVKYNVLQYFRLSLSCYIDQISVWKTRLTERGIGMSKSSKYFPEELAAIDF